MTKTKSYLKPELEKLKGKMIPLKLYILLTLNEHKIYAQLASQLCVTCNVRWWLMVGFIGYKTEGLFRK